MRVYDGRVGAAAAVSAHEVVRGLRELVAERDALLVERGELERLRDEALAMMSAVSRVLEGGVGVGVGVERDGERVLVGGEPLALSPRELALFCHLADRAGETVRADELLGAVWPGGVDQRTLRVHLSLLRGKLRRSGADGMRIRTMHGAGYRMEGFG